MIVRDAQADSRFSDNPLVTGAPHIRFYAGAPIITKEGVALGTLCAIDRKPRDLEPEAVSALQSLANHASILIELRNLAAAYREAGWVVRAYLPQQDIAGGTVTIQIVEAIFGAEAALHT